MKALLTGACCALAFAGLGGVAQAAGISGDVVKIGVLNDQSGVYSDATGPGSTLAAQMAVEEFGGKVLGAPIEIVVADHQNKADIAAGIANRWIDDEGVDAITDLPNSSAMLAVQEIMRNKKRILLESGGGSSDFTGTHCSPYGFHWTYDTYSLAKVTGSAITKEGSKKWFNVVVDYAFGEALNRDLTKAVVESGGEVIGEVKHPISNADFSSYLLQAQGSGADVIGLLNAGGDTTTAVKQAAEFGITQAGQKLAGLLVFVNTIKALGLDTAQGLQFTAAFYWDLNDETRAWSQKFYDRHGAMPSFIQAGVYSAVLHYLKAIEAAGTDDADAVADMMRKTPVNDMFAKNGKIRADGRMVHEMYLMEVKKPSEASDNEWDLMKLVRAVPGEEAFRPLNEGGCPLVK
ncbi:ABC transporter substrate-binding protein [Oceanibacterium hippocampi]|uniref:Receptor family ligand binding region n=1 Tax=Oceanibacterium hippocampi TaxID=745714 RepID=A0A1Y5TY22_9PROT|nr:ABC transporter substrate-binding protein [Oceanibacterium hippocampi]SLN76651.1 Receptor family ligand binding region [Oceanibacterium hippocampi]